MQQEPQGQLEPVLEPDLPICDPHHHLWDFIEGDASRLVNLMRLPRTRFLFDDLLEVVNSGHNVVSTVYVQARAFYRKDGPAEMRPVGETEYVNGVAAMSASGRYGPARLCEGIVAQADLLLGDRVEAVLEAHVRAGGDRLRGIRQNAARDDLARLPRYEEHYPDDLYADASFREGLACLARFGLSFDTWLYHPQLPGLIALADAFPDLPIVLNHMGTPLGIGPYAQRRAEVFEEWRASIRELARRPNVWVKLGGLGMVTANPDYADRRERVTSLELAEDWKPYIETCIDAFGVERSMFESNFPVDEASCSYRVLWNAFKRIAADYSPDEKASLFRNSAERFYRIAPGQQ